MRILYDGRLIDTTSGLGKFSGELLIALLGSARPDVTVRVLASRHLTTETAAPYLRRLQPHVGSGRCRIEYVRTPAISLEQQWAIPRLVRRLGGDLYFYPHFDVPAAVSLPFVFVVHDLIPLKLPDYLQRFRRAKQAYFRWCIQRGLRRAQRCITVSRTTKADLLAEFGGRWDTKTKVSLEGSLLDPTIVDHSLRKSLGADGPYLLYVGTRRPNKNLRFMIDMYAEMRRRFGYPGRLIIAGSRTNFGFDVDAYAATTEGVTIVGPVSDAQLASLYASTDALMFLSRYEGFGLPVIEAAAFGRRIIVSDGGSLAEIAPPWALVLPLTADTANAAQAAITYLAATGSGGHHHDSYSDQFAWPTVARAIFSEAY